jgi:ubiquinone/menaquinone biosynthesis C-methylase UbiE
MATTMQDEREELGELDRGAAVVAALGGDLSGLHVVDIGCGEGAVARLCAGAGAIVQGYDPFIVGTDWADHGAGRFRLSKIEGGQLPQADATADVVLFVYSLHHVPQAMMGGMLAEARRILKPGGRLCIAEPLAEGRGQYVMELYHDETEVRRNAIAAIAEHARPAFGNERLIHFAEMQRFADFGGYRDQAIANMRYNGYSEADVLAPEVARRFEEVAGPDGATFRNRARINLFS